jgi:hypothetical protein
MHDAALVEVFNLQVPPGALVFHLHEHHGRTAGHCTLDPTYERWVHRTACGRVSYVGWCLSHTVTEGQVGHRDWHRTTSLRRDQAELLGRLCARCAAADERAP